MDGEAFVTRPYLALGAGQGVFLMGLGMEEDGEVLAYQAVAEVQHLLHGGTHHHPVPVHHRQAQQFVPH